MNTLNTPIYIYPKAAKKKLRLAQNEGRNVYIFAMVGYGKSALVEHFLEKRKYIRLDVENSLIDDYEISEKDIEKKRVVVVENLQFVENAEIKEKIHQLVMRKDLWVILVSRAECPPWLMDLNFDQDAFMLIDEKDLTLSKKEMADYMHKSGLTEMDAQMEEQIWRDTRGHGLTMKLLGVALNQERMIGGKVQYNEALRQKIEGVLWQYVNQVVYEKWRPEISEFFMQMSIVESFTVSLAKAITGTSRVEYILEQAQEIGSFLTCEEGIYVMETEMRMGMRQKIKVEYDKERLRMLYYNAGHFYRQNGSILEALQMFEMGEHTDQVEEILLENVRMNPGSGYLYELRHYYLTMSEEQLHRYPELMAGMCMLQDILLNAEQSEYWYRELEKERNMHSGAKKRIIKSWLAYLDIALPHRGSKNLLELLVSAGRLLSSRELFLPELSVTGNSPSNMNGGKDFCEWTRKDKELAGSVGKVVRFVLGRHGAGIVELGLAESFLEKGKSEYEIISLISKGQMLAETKESLEQSFVAVGLMAKLHIQNGHPEDAKAVLLEFRERAKKKGAEKLVVSADNELCQIHLYMNELWEVTEWMKTAPKENQEFYTMYRYQYMTKIRVYIAQQKWELAQFLLEKMLYYANECDRVYIRMECELLLALLQQRLGREEWQETLQKVYSQAEDYEFVRLLSKEGKEIRALFQSMGEQKLVIKKPEFYHKVMVQLERMEDFYPKYLKEYINEVSITGKALQTLRYQAEGMKNAEIAEKLGVNINTVKYHCKENYAKLGVKNRAAAVLEARRRKII